MKEIEYVVSRIGLHLYVRLDRTEEEIRRHRSRIERWFYRNLRGHPTWEVVRPPEIRLQQGEAMTRDRQALIVVADAIDCEDPKHASSVRHLLAEHPYMSVRIPVMEPLSLVVGSRSDLISEMPWSRERREISDSHRHRLLCRVCGKPPSEHLNSRFGSCAG